MEWNVIPRPGFSQPVIHPRRYGQNSHVILDLAYLIFEQVDRMHLILSADLGLGVREEWVLEHLLVYIQQMPDRIPALLDLADKLGCIIAGFTDIVRVLSDGGFPF